MKTLLFIIIFAIVAILIWSVSKPNNADINQNIENADNIELNPGNIKDVYELRKLNDCVKKCTKLFCEEESGKTVCFDTIGLNECADACGWED
ncbi:MAG: hypothetical protein WCW66_05280 [Patescibacteria group bacterium]|jgi:hypothetical protein